MQLLNKQQKDSEKYKLGYLKRYDDVINDRKKELADECASRMNNLHGDNSSLKERRSRLMKALDSAKQETLDWRINIETVVEYNTHQTLWLLVYMDPPRQQTTPYQDTT